MKFSKVFNGIFFLNLLAVVVIAVQAFTGSFIEPQVQVAILAIVNTIFRMVTGNVAIAGPLKAPVEMSFEKPKIWYESKMLWTSVISFFGVLVQSLTGWVIPQEAYLEIISGLTFVISIVTHKPIRLS